MNEPIAAGVDIGGTKVLAVGLDASHQVVALHRLPTPADPDALVDTIGTALDGLGRPVASLGVGIAGLVTVDGQVRVSPHLSRPTELDLPTRLGARTGLAVRVDNDANAAAWGEAQLGAGRGASDVVVVTLGTGIGAGIVANGRLVRGAHGFAGEPGHMTVNFDGEHAVTGLAGSWELYGSGTALRRLAGGTVDHAYLATEAGMAVLDAYAARVAAGVGNLVNLLDPEVVVIGGGVSTIGEPLLTAIERHVPDWVLGVRDRPRLRLALAELGERAGAIGAALLGASPVTGA